LIVEDNAALRVFIGSGLHDRFSVLTAMNGEQGFAMAITHVPDVIISDVMMPGINGLEFATKIKENEKTSHIPVILLTAKADNESKMEALNKRVDDYLSKPFSMEELRLRIANLIDQRKKMAAKLRAEFSDLRSVKISEPSMEEKFMMKVHAVIESNLGNPHFGVEMLADEMSLSRAQLFRKLKALVNTSPRDLINDIRLKRAAELILAKADNVAQIGYSVGFSEQSYFAKRFRKKYGVSPTEYAK
jgi:YesN/AraC family two-component response regulator